MYRYAVAALFILPSLVYAERARPIHRFPSPPAASNVLWVAAHPDDELLAAPFLAVYCRERAARCTFLVATRGESGWCGLPVCAPDLATVREQELRASAALFSANVVLGSFADGSSNSPDAVLSRWNAGSALDTFLDAALKETDPDLVLTLDPRHGSTCHPDHRAIGHAAIDAARRSGRPAGVVLTRALPIGDWDGVDINPNLTGADVVIDAARPSSAGGSRWDALLDIARVHASQFPARAIRALEDVPSERRLVGIEFLAQWPASDLCAP